MTGDVTADLFASTTGSDGDWIVKLIDVAPDGQQTMVVDEIFRGRYRQSFETPHAIHSGQDRGVQVVPARRGSHLPPRATA